MCLVDGEKTDELIHERSVRTYSAASTMYSYLLDSRVEPFSLATISRC